MLSETILCVIQENKYVKCYKESKKKDENSLKNLLTDDFNITQSQCIKLGFALEKVIFDIIQSNKDFENLKQKAVKGEKELDLVFRHIPTNTIFYAELKSNLNLDTEKAPETQKKCLNIQKQLKEKYPNCIIDISLVGLTFFEKYDIKRSVINKYDKIKEYVVGLNDFFQKLNISIFETRENHKEFVNQLASKMFHIPFDIQKIYLPKSPSSSPKSSPSKSSPSSNYDKDDLHKYTVKELKYICKQLSLKNYSKLTKEPLIEKIISNS
jgi:hypothetical protein